MFCPFVSGFFPAWKKSQPASRVPQIISRNPNKPPTANEVPRLLVYSYHLSSTIYVQTLGFHHIVYLFSNILLFYSCQLHYLIWKRLPKVRNSNTDLASDNSQFSWQLALSLSALVMYLLDYFIQTMHLVFHFITSLDMNILWSSKVNLNLNHIMFKWY